MVTSSSEPPGLLAPTTTLAASPRSSHPSPWRAAGSASASAAPDGARIADPGRRDSELQGIDSFPLLGSAGHRVRHPGADRRRRHAGTPAFGGWRRIRPKIPPGQCRPGPGPDHPRLCRRADAGASTPPARRGPSGADLLPGCGIWTPPRPLQRALGDADAIGRRLPPATMIGWTLLGRRSTVTMEELLEPMRPHRYHAWCVLTRVSQLARLPRRSPSCRCSASAVCDARWRSGSLCPR